MTIETKHQTIEVTDVGQLVVSAIEQDPDQGGYVREVRVFAAGTGSDTIEVFRLRVRSDTREGIAYVAPSLNL